MPILYCKYFL